MNALLYIILSVALAGPGLWLLRRDTRRASFLAIVLLTVATAAGYIGVRLWAPPQEPKAAFIHTAAPGHFQVISPAELGAALAWSQGRPVLLEFYADWCSSCQVWKDSVFSRSDVQSTMTPLVLLQIDASELTPDVQALLDHYSLAGLPALLVFDRSGRERPELRLLGEMPAPEFIDWLQARLLPSM